MNAAPHQSLLALELKQFADTAPAILWITETDGAWKRQGTTVDNLTKELRLALQYPEGAAG